jgi:hypothetical protein
MTQFIRIESFFSSAYSTKASLFVVYYARIFLERGDVLAFLARAI